MRSDIKELLNALQVGQGMSRKEAIETIKDMMVQVREGADPEELLYDVGLEPDYVFALM